jgi:hypothetical protein
MHHLMLYTAPLYLAQHFYAKFQAYLSFELSSWIMKQVFNFFVMWKLVAAIQYVFLAVE